MDTMFVQIEHGHNYLLSLRTLVEDGCLQAFHFNNQDTQTSGIKMQRPGSRAFRELLREELLSWPI